MNFRVSLADYLGPIELLVQLVRRDELDILRIPLADITAQYAAFLGDTVSTRVDEAGDFLALASTLMEWKATTVLPDDEEKPLDPPAQACLDLVRHLVEYREFREAAASLLERARLWEDRFPRFHGGGAARGEVALASQPIREIQVWDLVSAYGRLIEEHGASAETQILYDETPIEVFAERIRSALARAGPVPFSSFLESGTDKCTLIGYFLAALELVRHGQIRLEQPDGEGEIQLIPGENFNPEIPLTFS